MLCGGDCLAYAATVGEIEAGDDGYGTAAGILGATGLDTTAAAGAAAAAAAPVALATDQRADLAKLDEVRDAGASSRQDRSSLHSAQRKRSIRSRGARARRDRAPIVEMACHIEGGVASEALSVPVA